MNNIVYSFVELHSSGVMFGRGSPKFNMMQKKQSPRSGGIQKKGASPKVARKGICYAFLFVPTSYTHVLAFNLI